MALFNGGFPATYPQMYPQYQQGYQMPQYQPMQGVQNIYQQPVQQQGMSPPTVHADIVQVSGEQEAMNYPVAAGQSQMMLAKDDSAIYVKTAFANGQSTLNVFVKRPPEPPQKPVDMTAYVTHDELESRLAALAASAAQNAPVKKTTKKEQEVSE